MKSKALKTILSASVLVLVITSCLKVFEQDVDREIAGSTTISSNWLEIELTEPLRPSRDFSVIVLVIAEPFTRDPGLWDLRLRDGTIAKPEVQIIDQNCDASVGIGV